MKVELFQNKHFQREDRNIVECVNLSLHEGLYNNREFLLLPSSLPPPLVIISGQGPGMTWERGRGHTGWGKKGVPCLVVVHLSLSVARQISKCNVPS